MRSLVPALMLAVALSGCGAADGADEAQGEDRLLRRHP